MNKISDTEKSATAHRAPPPPRLSAYFLPYFHPKLFFTSQLNNHNHKKIGSRLQIEIVSLGCPLSPSEIDMQLHRIFCDPFHGFPPPPSPNPFQK